MKFGCDLNLEIRANIEISPNFEIQGAPEFQNSGKFRNWGDDPSSCSTNLETKVLLRPQYVFGTSLPHHLTQSQADTRTQSGDRIMSTSSSEHSDSDASMGISCAQGSKKPMTSTKGTKRSQQSTSPVRKKRRSALQQNSPDQTRNSDDDVPSENEDQKIAMSKDKFYNAMRTDIDNMMPPGARTKFPIKEKIPQLIEMIKNVKDIPNCSQKHALLKKWVIRDGLLCSVTKKAGKEPKPVTAYEDIFHKIFDVDQKSNFENSIEKLSIAVQDESNNISEKMVQLYSRCCYKREHKHKGITPRKPNKKPENTEHKKKVAEFLQKLKECTAVQIFEVTKHQGNANIMKEASVPTDIDMNSSRIIINSIDYPMVLHPHRV